MNHLNMRIGLGTALDLMGGAAAAETQEPQPEADKEADELAREVEAMRRLERDQQERAQALLQCLYYPVETLNIPKMPTCHPEPRRRSKRAQRARERGWR